LSTESGGGHHRQRRVLIPGGGQPGRRLRDRQRPAGDEAEVPRAAAGHGRGRACLVQQGEHRRRVQARPGRVAAGQIIHQRDLRAAGQDGAEVYPRNRHGPVCDRRRGDTLNTREQGLGARPAVRFDARYHYVGAVLRALAAFAEQCAGCAGTRCATQVDPQVTAGGRGLAASLSAH
jgi:hypothetical protein